MAEESTVQGLRVLRPLLDAERRQLRAFLKTQGQPFFEDPSNANPAFERQTGLKDVEGRSARELVPGLEAHWFESYGRVALSGEPVRFENGSESLGPVSSSVA